MSQLTFAGMFSGVGGFRLAFGRSGWRCVWANDNDRYANMVYKKKFGDGELVEGDIRQVDEKEIPDHTLLTAGFPCQAFSVAGKRKGLKEGRGTLFTHIARVAGAKRPKLLLLENVKGILSSQSGRTFAVILRTLANMGYLLEWQVLNSKHFGVPQNRERVFIVGHLRGERAKQIFPIGEARKISYAKGNCEPESGEKASTLEASYWKAKSMNNLVLCSIINRWRKHKDKPWLKSKQGKLDLPKNGERIVMLANRTAGGSAWRKEVPSLDQSSSVGYVDEELRIRRLTPTECERLQGFPDGWTELGVDGKGRTVRISDTQRYKMLGNAVTVNVAEFLGERLRECVYG